MLKTGEERIGLADLQTALRAADPAVIFVPALLLSRVIKHDRRITGIGLQVPHDHCYVVKRDSLLEAVDASELGLASDAEAAALPDRVILIAAPLPEKLSAMSKEAALLHHWRTLFHARIHSALEARLAARELTPAGVRERIHRVGQTEFDEIRTVLRRENLLLPPRDDATTYIEFAALYLELRQFAPHLLERYFPTIWNPEKVDELLGEDVDSVRIFNETRPAGAPLPAPPPVLAEFEGEGPPPGASGTAPTFERSPEKFRDLMSQADRASEKGNSVRAAILRTHASFTAAPEAAAATHAAARSDLERLAHRLKDALELDAAAFEIWRKGLPTLLEPSAKGMWPAAARLLYDLQKTCLDHEREVFAIGVVDWIVTAGQVPLKRPLPNQRWVRICKHLRSASRRLSAARISDTQRRLLVPMLEDAIHHAEARLHERLRPLLEQALADVGIVPRNVPERVSLNKLTEELLDVAIHRGFLTIGDLRDTISRNHLKLPDLSLGELFRGDRLLRLDKKLALMLDGVYRRGEIYMRGLQRLSSLFFGTGVGRFLTLFVALPFGGAFIILEGLQHMIEPICHKILHVEPIELMQHAAVSLPGEGQTMHLNLSVLALGIFLMGLIHHRGLRKMTVAAASTAFSGLRAVLIELPSKLLKLPWLREILDSRSFRILSNTVLKPMLFAVPAWWLARRNGLPDENVLAVAGGVFVAMSLFFNSRFGRRLEEAIADGIARTWYQFRTSILAGVFILIMEVFKTVLEWIERILYSVDEQLRFRKGDGAFSFITKGILGIVWFAVAYLIRFVTNLLIEPQVNPIKHFPVVTVSHKLILPLQPELAGLLKATMSAPAAQTTAAVVVTGIPGIFGFLVWELMANWRLYEANRAPELGPVIIGSHGETMIRLMKPGFHSGTLPKLYTKLRRAECKPPGPARRKAVRKQREALHHVEESLRHFVERDFIAFLRASRSWQGLHVDAGEIRAGSNRIGLEVVCPQISAENLWIIFEEQSGWLVASTQFFARQQERAAGTGWLRKLTAAQAATLADALAGFYKMGGVDLVREQLETAFEGYGSAGQRRTSVFKRRAPVTYDIADEGLIVWPGTGYATEAVYDLRSEPLLNRKFTVGEPQPLPDLHADHTLFSRRPIRWSRWVETWDAENEDRSRQPAIEGVKLLREA